MLCIANREATNREAPNREAANREAANREGPNREAANREAPNREAANREARGPEGGRGTPKCFKTQILIVQDFEIEHFGVLEPLGSPPGVARGEGQPVSLIVRSPKDMF